MGGRGGVVGVLGPAESPPPGVGSGWFLLFPARHFQNLGQHGYPVHSSHTTTACCTHIFPPSLCLAHCCTFLNSQYSPASEFTVKLVTCRENFAGGKISPLFLTAKSSPQHSPLPKCSTPLYATKAIMPKSASLRQNINVMHLKTQVSHSTHGTQQDQLKNAPPKSTVRKLTDPRPGVAWTRKGGGGLLGKPFCETQPRDTQSARTTVFLTKCAPLTEVCARSVCQGPGGGISSGAAGG